MIFTLNDSKVGEGTILLFGIRYGASASGKIYTFAGLKAGGRWYFTGTGPTDASWSAVQRWLQRDGRSVVWVRVVTGMDLLWDEKSASKANHPSRTGSPVVSMRNLAEETEQERADLVASRPTGSLFDPDEADELLEDVDEFPSAEPLYGIPGVGMYGHDYYGN